MLLNKTYFHGAVKFMGGSGGTYSYSYGGGGCHVTLFVFGLVFFVHGEVDKVWSSHWLNKLHGENPCTTMDRSKLPALREHKGVI